MATTGRQAGTRAGMQAGGGAGAQASWQARSAGLQVLHLLQSDRLAGWQQGCLLRMLLAWRKVSRASSSDSCSAAAMWSNSSPPADGASASLSRQATGGQDWLGRLLQSPALPQEWQRRGAGARLARAYWNRAARA